MGNENQFRIELDYAIAPKPRWGHGRPVHARIAEILGRRHATYASHLRNFVPHAEALGRIPVRGPTSDDTEPFWNNSWFEGIDGLSLYCFLANRRPRRYWEVGSGNSTKFAARAIRDHRLATEILSIDPCPRAEVDRLCQRVVRMPLEDMDPTRFRELQGGDVLLIDNSHRVFMNSDVTAFFLDVLTELAPDVLVGIHDIMWPADYPAGWCQRYYSEQYMLGAYLLAEGSRIQVELPSAYVGSQPDLMAILNPIWSRPELKGANPFGSSFWLLTRKQEPARGE